MSGTFESYTSFSFNNYNGQLEIVAESEESWVSDGKGNSWDVGISLPEKRSQTGCHTQTLERCEGDGEEDLDIIQPLLDKAEEKFDADLRGSLEEYLEDKHVTSKCPRGFANEVIYTIHDGEKEDCEKESLIAYLTSVRFDLDASRVEIETNPEDIYLVDVVWGANDPNDAWFDEDENLLSEEAAVERLKNQVSDDEEGYVFVVYVYGNEIESGWIVENGKLVRIVNWDLVEYRVNR